MFDLISWRFYDCVQSVKNISEFPVRFTIRDNHRQLMQFSTELKMQIQQSNIMENFKYLFFSNDKV